MAGPCKGLEVGKLHLSDILQKLVLRPRVRRSLVRNLLDILKTGIDHLLLPLLGCMCICTNSLSNLEEDIRDLLIGTICREGFVVASDQWNFGAQFKVSIRL